MEIGGRGAAIGRGQMAFVDADACHDQVSDQANRSFILDLDPAIIAPSLRERLGRNPYRPLSPAASKLVDFMALMAADRAAPAIAVEHWAPLLFETLDEAPAAPRSRLAALLALVETDPGSSWTTATMASRAGLSVSRLHAVFREELDTTPIAWLSHLRLERVREELRSTRRSIAELAYRNGYADQSALTRAMRRETGLTPGVYRRQAQESGTRKR